ncbi:MAG: autotransporter beta- protein [Moraxellaceae bacterium]|jgi:autotransporter-associated beta strand protein|nr:autotransporter beta- protein [Moraxellaceae bacterium]
MRRLSPPSLCPPFARRALVTACLLGLLQSAQAATYAVTTEAELRAAILSLNGTAGAHFIDIRSSIALTDSLPAITNAVSLRGNGFSLEGQSQHQMLVLGDPAGVGPRILVQVSNLTLAGGLAQGEAGSAGGGGGLGAGGALLVNSRADVLLSNVTVINSEAAGGAGAPGLGGDGGGFEGGAGGTGTVAGSAGDGGFGAGGGSSQAGDGGDGGFGGGGGAGATGGAAGTGGGAGGTTGGGGGAGFGGAIYVADGGSLSISSASTIKDNDASGGFRAGDAAVGTAAGDGIFLGGSGNLLLRVGGSQVLTIEDSISDSVGTGLLPASSYAQWNVLVAGGGATLRDAADPTSGLIYGQVVLGGENRFNGNLYVEGADVLVRSIGALGTGSGVVALNDGGLLLSDGLTLSRDIVVDNGGARVGVTSGEAVLASDISGSGTVVKSGSGDLVLAGTSSHVGSWRVSQGALVLDSDARLGGSSLELDGGRIRFADAFALRPITLLSTGTIDNGGFDIDLSSISGWNVSLDGTRPYLAFDGDGTTTLTGTQTSTGDTVILDGRVAGAIATGSLHVHADAVYDLGGANRTIAALNGVGTVELGAQRLTISLGSEDPPLDAAFSGTITGTGGVTITRSVLPPTFNPLADFAAYGAQSLAAGNTYSGGTTVDLGAILNMADDTSIGTGPLTLAGGAFSSQQSSSDLDITLAGGGGVIGDITLNGVISGVGNFVKYGAGTLTLTRANTYLGNAVVMGEGSYLALANPNALGSGNLQLTMGGGLKVLTDTVSLRPIQILNGIGVVDVGTYDVQSVGGITGSAADSALRKEGTGRLLLTGTLDLPGGVDIAAGTLQVGNGGAGGSISGNVGIASGAQLVINRSGALNLDGNITGAGSVLVNGSGTVTFNPGEANTFLGGLTVLNGLVGAYSERGLGFGTVTLDQDGGIVLLGDIDRDITVGSGGGRLVVNGSDSFVYDGDFAQTGLFTKTGTGTLVFTGLAGSGGDVHVAEGTLQIGSGLKGILASDVAVDTGASLVFGRSDLTQYGQVISGDGTVIKQGGGELVLTGDQLFTGTFQVESGNLRVGLGGSTGSLNGDVDLAAGTRVIFDRSDASVFSGDTSGAGLVQKSGPGLLTVLGDFAHAGGTQVYSGELQIGDGGTVGNISGAVGLALGTRLVINRSDDVTVAADLAGAGLLVQRGDGTTVLTGTNTQTGGVVIEGGRLGVDSDARLGSGELIMDGGLLRFEAAFDDLRAIRLRAGGGGLDTNGFDVAFDSQVSGNGLFIKDGAGRLSVTSLLGSNVSVLGGELRVGDGGTQGLLTGNAFIATGATLSLDRSDVVNFTRALTGSGDLRQLGTGELRLPGDNSAFAGHTWVDNGSLRLDGLLGGDLTLAAGTGLQGTGTLLGDLDAGNGRVAPGNSFGTLSIGGDFTLGAGSELEIEVDASGATDRVVVGGTATLGGTLTVLPQPGDYTVAGCCSYTILTAGAVTGSFATVNNELVFLTTSVAYGPTDVQVAFARNSIAFNTVTLNWNQQQVATAIDAMEAANASDPLAARIAPLSAEQARDAFSALSGDSLLVAANAGARSAARFSQLLSRRGSRLGLASRGGVANFPLADLNTLRQGTLPQPPAVPAASAPMWRYDGPTSRIEGVWVDAVAVETSESSDDSVGSAGGSLSGQLLALGVDGYWRDELLLGFAAGTLDGDLAYDNRAAEGTASATFAGLYGRWDSGAGLQYKGALSMAAQDSDVTRRIPFGGTVARTQGTLATSTLSAAFEAGLPLHVASLGLRPHALLNVQLLERDALQEAGPADVTLTAASGSEMLGEFGIGLELSRPWLAGDTRWAQLNGGLALLQPFGATQGEQTLRFGGAANTFTVKSTADDSAALALSVGAEVYLTTQLALWGGYEGRVSGSSDEHNGVLSMQYRW